MRVAATARGIVRTYLTREPGVAYDWRIGAAAALAVGLPACLGVALGRPGDGILTAMAAWLLMHSAPRGDTRDRVVSHVRRSILISECSCTHIRRTLPHVLRSRSRMTRRGTSGDHSPPCPPHTTNRHRPGHSPPAAVIRGLSNVSCRLRLPVTARQEVDHPCVTPEAHPTDTPSERAPHERHEHHFSGRTTPAVPTPHIMRTHKTAGQDGLATGSRIATPRT